MSETEFSRESCTERFPVTVVHVHAHPAADADRGDEQARPQRGTQQMGTGWGRGLLVVEACWGLLVTPRVTATTASSR
jgi:hypothetical protein